MSLNAGSTYLLCFCVCTKQKDIADATGLDISTVSRVANSKYVQTEFGTMFDAAGLHMSSDGSVTIANQSADIGLSPPNSGWMTLFGQFFDHGLDLVTKGGNGTIYIPLQPDDPLYDPTPGAPNFSK